MKKDDNSTRINIKEEHRFQYKLAIFVFSLTIISSIISGYSVYYLTSDKSPTVTIYPAGQDSNYSYNFIVSNLKDVPADHIILGYKFKGVENVTYFLGSVPFLSKGTTIVRLDLNKVQQNVIEVAEKKFSQVGNPNDFQPFRVEVGDKFGYNMFADMFDLVITAECKTCKSSDIIIYFTTIKFTPEITCQHFNVTRTNFKNFSCQVEGYSTSAPY